MLLELSPDHPPCLLNNPHDHPHCPSLPPPPLDYHPDQPKSSGGGGGGDVGGSPSLPACSCAFCSLWHLCIPRSTLCQALWLPGSSLLPSSPCLPSLLSPPAPLACCLVVLSCQSLVIESWMIASLFGSSDFWDTGGSQIGGFISGERPVNSSWVA